MNKVKMKRIITYKIPEDMNLYNFCNGPIICPEKVIIDPEKLIKVEPRMIREDFREPKHPDPKMHQNISFLKSAVRLSGYGALMYDIGLGVIILIISEVIGIIEELV